MAAVSVALESDGGRHVKVSTFARGVPAPPCPLPFPPLLCRVRLTRIAGGAGGMTQREDDHWHFLFGARMRGLP